MPDESIQPGSGHRGRIDASWIDQHMKDPAATIANAAGSPSFVAQMHATLASIGFPDEWFASNNSSAPDAERAAPADARKVAVRHEYY